MKNQINIGVADAITTAKDFIDAWKKAESGEKIETEVKLNFESLETLLKKLTSGRWLLLKTLHKTGPMSIRALAKNWIEIIKTFTQMCVCWRRSV